jgi:hypothetical protein
LVEWSTPTHGGHVCFYIEGETRDGVIIRNVNTETDDWRMFLVRCNCFIRNLTMDVNGLGTHMDCISAFGQNSTTVLDVQNCHFMKHTGCGVRTGAPWAALVCHDNLFDQPGTFEDQIAISVSEYCRITNNFMDRTNGAYNLGGSNVTAGNGKRILIANNQMKRTFPYGSYAISLENVAGFEDCIIANNIIDNGWINVDGSISTNNVHRIKIHGNNIFQGGIRILGPPATPDKVKYITVEGNTLIDSQLFGIKIADIAGRSTVKNNLIVNSNKELASNAGGYQQDIGLIRIVNVSDLEVTDNTLEMNVTSPANSDFSWYGIRYQGLNKCIVERNRIINRTLANSSYVDLGGNTNCEISRDVAATT